MTTTMDTNTETAAAPGDVAALEAAFLLPAVEPVRTIADAPRDALGASDYLFMALLAALAVGAVLLLAMTTFA